MRCPFHLSQREREGPALREQRGRVRGYATGSRFQDHARNRPGVTPNWRRKAVMKALGLS
jgi:hypothetical protein